MEIFAPDHALTPFGLRLKRWLTTLSRRYNSLPRNQWGAVEYRRRGLRIVWSHDLPRLSIDLDFRRATGDGRFLLWVRAGRNDGFWFHASLRARCIAWQSRRPGHGWTVGA